MKKRSKGTLRVGTERIMADSVEAKDLISHESDSSLENIRPPERKFDAELCTLAVSELERGHGARLTNGRHCKGWTTLRFCRPLAQRRSIENPSVIYPSPSLHLRLSQPVPREDTIIK